MTQPGHDTPYFKPTWITCHDPGNNAPIRIRTDRIEAICADLDPEDLSSLIYLTTATIYVTETVDEVFALMNVTPSRTG